MIVEINYQRLVVFSDTSNERNYDFLSKPSIKSFIAASCFTEAQMTFASHVSRISQSYDGNVKKNRRQPCHHPR